MEQLCMQSVYRNRRELLISRIKQHMPAVSDGIVLLAGAFEQSLYRFRQESSLYYYTGLNEPAVVLALDFSGASTLYIPDFGNERGKWVTLAISLDSNPADYGVDAIKPLGEPAQGYAYGPYFNKAGYAQLVRDLDARINASTVLFSLFNKESMLFEQQALIKSIQEVMTKQFAATHDMSSVVHRQRRSKDMQEIMLIKEAIAITSKAQAVAAASIARDVAESSVQAEIEKVFTAYGAQRPSFPSIVACGVNSTILHYTDNNKFLRSGDLVVVDIGAEYHHYAADLTRTYPVGGFFSAEQKKIYQMVLDAQTEIAAYAKPGMFLRNAAAKEQSLHYLTGQFFKRYGHEQYFPHGIGHYMGLDVHDVGDYTQPLMPGDVFTIEPGLYLRDKAIGVRIEDDYLMTEQGAICLSADLPKEVAAIEDLFVR